MSAWWCVFSLIIHFFIYKKKIKRHNHINIFTIWLVKLQIYQQKGFRWLLSWPLGIKYLWRGLSVTVFPWVGVLIMIPDKLRRAGIRARPCCPLVRCQTALCTVRPLQRSVTHVWRTYVSSYSSRDKSCQVGPRPLSENQTRLGKLMSADFLTTISILRYTWTHKQYMCGVYWLSKQ